MLLYSIIKLIIKIIIHHLNYHTVKIIRKTFFEQESITARRVPMQTSLSKWTRSHSHVTVRTHYIILIVF